MSSSVTPDPKRRPECPNCPEWVCAIEFKSGRGHLCTKNKPDAGTLAHLKLDPYIRRLLR